MQYVPAAVAAATGLYVGSRAGSSVRAAIMPKRPLVGPMQAAVTGDFYGRKGFRKRARASIAKKRRFIGPIQQKMVRKSNDMNTHFEVLKNLVTVNVAGGNDRFFRFGPHNVTGCPSWNYWTNLFDTFKIHWIRVKFHMPGGAFLCSFTDTDNIDLPNDIDIILRNAGARVHDTTTDKHMRQRYMSFAGMTALEDFIKHDNDTIGSVLGNNLDPSNAPPQNDGRLAKAMICCGCRNDADLQIHCALEFGVTFRGLSDHASLYS